MSLKSYNRETLIQYCSENNIQYDSISDDVKINRETKIKGICKTDGCLEKFDKCFRYLVNTTGPYCNICSKKRCKEKTKQTCLDNFGVAHFLQCKEVIQKRTDTCIKKYGVQNVFQSKEIKEKLKQTMLQKFGVENASQNEDIQEKKKQTSLDKYGVEHPFQNEEIREKFKETCQNKYGAEHPSQSEEIKEKKKQTTQDNYGVDNPFQSEEIKVQIKITNMKKYGVEHSSQSKEIKEKVKQTCWDKYGVEHHMHLPEIADKCSRSSYRTKDYIMPSGKILKIQGYENYALDELIQIYQDDDIINGMTNVPEIWYEDEEGKKHRHYVDIFIPSKQLCIEVKSSWTAEKKKDNIFLKQNAGKELGYSYEIWVYDEKRNKIKI